MRNPSVLLIEDFFANPRCPPGASTASYSVDPVVVSGEDRSTNSPSAAGKETVLPMDKEEAVLPIDREEVVLPTNPPAE